MRGDCEGRLESQLPLWSAESAFDLTGFSKLLHGPGCSRIGRDIAVKNAATSHFHHHEHVQHSEASRDGYQEVSGHNSLGVIADKRTPVLRTCSPTASRIPLLRPVRS